MYKKVIITALAVLILIINDCSHGLLLKHRNYEDPSINSVTEFLERELNRVNNPLLLCLMVPENLEQRLDSLAQALETEIQRPGSDIIVNGIGKLVNIDELTPNNGQYTPSHTYTPSEVIEYSRIGRPFNYGTPSLMDSLAQSYSKPHVFHRPISIDSKKFEIVNSAVAHEWSVLPKGERERLTDALAEASRLSNRKAVAHERKKRSLANNVIRPVAHLIKTGIQLAPNSLIQLTTRVLQVGVKVLDMMYMAPEFVEQLPVLGEHLRVLKAKGKPMYDMIEYVRHAHYLFKVTQSENGHEEEDPIKTTRAKQMMGDLGVRALKSVATIITQKISKSSLDEDGKQEIISRLVHTLLAVVLPKSDNNCNL